MRYPRGTGPGAAISASLDPLPIGKGRILREGQGVALLAFGAMVTPALAAAQATNATVADMRFIKPIDQALVHELAARHPVLVTLEENTVAGGAGSEVARCLESAGLTNRLVRLGLPDQFIDHGDSVKLLAEHGLDAAGIEATLKALPIEPIATQ